MLADFVGNPSQHQMSVHDGDAVVVVHRMESGWWYAHRLRGTDGTSLTPGALVDRSRIDFRKQGFVPGSFVRLTGDTFEYRPSGSGAAAGTPQLRCCRSVGQAGDAAASSGGGD